MKPLYIVRYCEGFLRGRVWLVYDTRSEHYVSEHPSRDAAFLAAVRLNQEPTAILRQLSATTERT